MLAAVLLGLSCGGTQPVNTGGNNSATNSPVQTDAAQSFAPPAEDCSGTGQPKIDKIYAKILKNLSNKPKLQYQVNNGQMGIETPVVDTYGNIELTVWGKVAGDDNLFNFVELFRGFLKKGCVSKVKFTMSGKAAALTAEGFEWNLCEYPKVACNGECVDTCGPMTGNTNSNVKTNSNVATNSANTVSNSNKP